ncbi:endoplasmic reticulum vesicle transporter-domain-containing protein [Mycena rosella]|uniref:Endoplasmic reticulum vesicle transporter-domain-containing protein n=1 Tax=Mycena rosella TaxID=1033263 RepID=A0AAD7D5K1_MYCRO|nr:endoplasmic reticulum vesicle transporter-domain-containing protein [Mycena rosella]
MSLDGEPSILEKLDAAVPVPLAQFDAFPKMPSAYKARSDSRGFLTIFVGLVTFMLMLNDIGEFIFGWPDHEFSVDNVQGSFMHINVDLVVAMPCSFISVDLRDAVGDRMFLSSAKTGIRRDGTRFDVGQATALKEHSEALSVRQAVAQSRKSRGFFSSILQWDSTPYMPRYQHEPDARGCRISGQLEVKKVTANLHITTLGHGYASHEHVDHSLMNLSHVITEFSFGPYFPDITQPLDNSLEITHDPFVAYQYFLHVVPTTYVAPRSAPLNTNQYSVTHYTRVLSQHTGTPGIFFKFDLDPMSLTIHQRTSSFLQLIIRWVPFPASPPSSTYSRHSCVGVIGGVFTCMGYAIRVTTAAVEAVTGESDGEIAPTPTASASALRTKFSGASLRARPKSGRLIPQGNGWVLEGTPGSPAAYGGGSPYGTPVSASFPTGPGSPYLASPGGPYTPGAGGASQPGTPSGVGLGFPASTFGPGGGQAPPMSARSSSGLAPRTPGVSSPRPLSVGGGMGSMPGTPQYGVFPPTPGPGAGFSVGTPPPPQGKRMSSSGSGGGGKKDD